MMQIRVIQASGFIHASKWLHNNQKDAVDATVAVIVSQPKSDKPKRGIWLAYLCISLTVSIGRSYWLVSVTRQPAFNCSSVCTRIVLPQSKAISAWTRPNDKTLGKLP